MKFFGKIAKRKCEADRQDEDNWFHMGTALYSKTQAKSTADYTEVVSNSVVSVASVSLW